MDRIHHKTGLEDRFVYENHKRLRLGYTTGTSAAAAAGAAAEMILSGEEAEEVSVETPAGILLNLLTEDLTLPRTQTDGSIFASAAVRKDGGDDVDATHGLLIYADVTVSDMIDTVPGPDGLFKPGDLHITIDGGKGVGRVTKPGLDRKIGEAAINTVPRQMIRETVENVFHKYRKGGSVDVIIRVPEGEAAAQKTFNGRLGIVGGISILGTSGIVMPMSEKAWLDSMRAEMKALVANGGDYLLLTPGNYGETFAASQKEISMSHQMQCSNFVGPTLDMAEELGVKGVLFVAHIGKFIKVSGGIMNTHSKEADCRAELMAAAALRAGAGRDCVERILASNTTEDALD
ncbi:MAG: cobalt-precorrin-5B (C(1))-methyltransferase CbiD, partial [Eubacterium sp.]|nr:cobalt-precorrin-5B (C(1))-methyltransferase CbiD [Eubacterium sp.]